MPIKLNGSTSGYVELAAPAVAGTTALELPTDSIKPGLVLVAAQSFSAVSSVSVNNCFTSAYQNYRLVWQIFGGSASSNLNFRLRASGSDNNSSVYKFTYLGYRSDSGTEQTQNTSASAWTLLSANGNDQTLCVYDILRPQVAETTAISGTGTRLNAAGVVGFLNFGGFHSANSPFDGFTLFPDSGTIQARVFVYGYRNSL